MSKQGIILAAVLLLGLSGCKERPAEESSAPESRPPAASVAVETPAVTETPAVVHTPVPTRGPDGSAPPAPTATTRPEATASPVPARPSDQEVLAAYREAEEAYSWFAGYSEDGLMLDGGDTLIHPEGTGESTFTRVTRPGLNSLDELRSYLKTLFSDEVVDPLLSQPYPMFVDGQAGGLYARGAGRGSDVTKGALTLTVEWPQQEDAAMCTVRAEVELLELGGEEAQGGGTQVYQFPYQKVGDKWVFTQFESIF